MVSLSPNESLEKMVQNYGFGASLFSQISVEQIEVLQDKYPEFVSYLNDLFSGRIYDPQAFQILEEKYKNDLNIIRPTVYEMKIQKDQLLDMIEQDDVDLLVFKMNEWVKSIVKEISSQVRQGDVVFVTGKDLSAYFIINKMFEPKNVYLQYAKLEINNPIRFMDLPGSTPINFWSEIEIPNLSFEFHMEELFEQIKWSKQNIRSQMYLVGIFNYKHKKVQVFVPIPKDFINMKRAADKLAVILQIQNKKVFLTEDPIGIVPNDPNVFFASVNEDRYLISQQEDETDEDDNYYD
jgi:hypothetical protein